MPEKSDRALLSEAVSKLVERFAKKHPKMGVAEACAALGVVAGTLAAVNVPAGNPEADLMIANLMGVGFGEAMKAARALRAN